MRYHEDIETRFTARHKACIEFSGDVRDRLMLDVGCWIGWYEKRMVERGCSFIVGVDLDHRSLLRAKEAIRCIQCEFLMASSSKLPFKSSCFDAVSLFEVLEHVPRGTELKVLSNINGVLKTRGSLLLSTPNNSFIAKMLDPAYFLVGHRHYSSRVLRMKLRKSNFDVDEISYGGGVIEMLSMILLYIFKHLFKMEIPFKRTFEQLRRKEYQGRGFATLFIKATKVNDLNQGSHHLK